MYNRSQWLLKSFHLWYMINFYVFITVPFYSSNIFPRLPTLSWLFPSWRTEKTKSTYKYVYENISVIITGTYFGFSESTGGLSVQRVY